MKSLLVLLDFLVILFEPSEGVPRVVVVDHFSDVFGVVPEIAKATRVVVGLLVVLVGFVPEPSCQ